MARHAKLVKKMQELVRTIKDSTRGKYDKMDLREEVMADSPGILALMRGHQRRIDDDFGVDVAASEPMMAIEISASDFDRHDFGVSDFGVRMVLGAGLVEALGLQAGDVIAVQEGEYEGRSITIESVDSSLDELRFADDAGKGAETDIAATARISSLT